MTINDEENWAAVYAEIFNYQIGTFSIKYLGVPVSPSRLHLSDWAPLVDKSHKRLDTWKGSTMSIAERTALISACLNNSPIYQMFVYLAPKTISDKIDKIRRTFFWQGEGPRGNTTWLNGLKSVKARRKVQHPGSQISHITTNRGNINRQCLIYNELNIKNTTLENKQRNVNSDLQAKAPNPQGQLTG